MRTVLITGGTGFLGSNLAHALLTAGCHVRILRRDSSDLRAIGKADVEHCIGDVRDIHSIRHAVKGCDTVFHTAALISYWRKEREQMLDINVKGTRNVVDACLEVGVQQLIHTSSVAAIGFRTDGQPADESNTFNWHLYDIGYRISKFRAEQEILRGVKQGLQAVMLNPSVIIGPRDIHFHGGQLLRDIARKRIFYYTAGSLNIVYVDDVVRGHLLAAQHGRTGERYILAGENVELRELFRRTAEISDGLKPLFKLPITGVKSLARVFETIGNMTNSRPWVGRELVAGLGIPTAFSSVKAQSELGYTYTPLHTALQQTYEWYRSSGLL